MSNARATAAATTTATLSLIHIFIEVLGNKGRDLFELYMPEVPHEKVMEQLSEHNQSILAQNPFLSPEALVKQTRESIRELESTLTYCCLLYTSQPLS